MAWLPFSIFLPNTLPRGTTTFGRLPVNIRVTRSPLLVTHLTVSRAAHSYTETIRSSEIGGRQS